MKVLMYLRISSEDTDMREKNKSESNSIAHQRWLLTDFVRNHPELCSAELDELCDDGWSGKNFERPGMTELLEQVRRGAVQCIVVKDFSRFGRDYLTVGNYISRVFPFMGVRFISVNDNFDSSRPGDIDSLDTSFKTLIYDLYSRELSQKVKAARKQRAEQGLFLSPFAPYGYAKDENDKNHLVIDESAAGVVRRIFRMTLDGDMPSQIAAALNREGVMTPMQSSTTLASPASGPASARIISGRAEPSASFCVMNAILELSSMGNGNESRSDIGAIRRWTGLIGLFVKISMKLLFPKRILTQCKACWRKAQQAVCPSD